MRNRGFTLIELLIVIAIIAILALIAIPNFMEAQTRAKVSRVQADMRSMATALEAYFVDYNAYPLADFRGSGRVDLHQAWLGWLMHETDSGSLAWMKWLNRPVAYLSGPPPRDPFIEGVAEDELTGATGIRRPLSFYYANFLGAQTNGATFVGNTDLITVPDVVLDGPEGFNVKAYWLLISAGPDKTFAGMSAGGQIKTSCFLHQKGNHGWLSNGQYKNYDPTNGTASRGDIWHVGGRGGM